MEMHMIHHLMCDAAVVLQDVVVCGARGVREFLGDGEDFGQRVVGDVG